MSMAVNSDSAQHGIGNCLPEPCCSAKELAEHSMFPCCREPFLASREKGIDCGEVVSVRRGPSPNNTAQEDRPGGSL
jgi:hypothetical protein